MWVTENCRVCVGEAKVEGDTPDCGEEVRAMLVGVTAEVWVAGSGEGLSTGGVGVMVPPPHLLGDPVRVNVKDTLMVPPP